MGGFPCKFESPATVGQFRAEFSFYRAVSYLITGATTFEETTDENYRPQHITTLVETLCALGREKWLRLSKPYKTASVGISESGQKVFLDVSSSILSICSGGRYQSM
jgi:hypothetical protein